MSDLKRSCPACGSYSSSVGIDFRNGDPCRYCGLSANAAFELDQAKERGAQQSAIDMAAKASARADIAEREVQRLRGLLDEISWVVERRDKPE
ncbi:MAG: hypothetical protein JWP74_1780 [Marmoricola sp.]|nr:hypothetical protein [Marmoricola sp.]